MSVPEPVTVTETDPGTIWTVSQCFLSCCRNLSHTRHSREEERQRANRQTVCASRHTRSPGRQDFASDS